VRFFPALVITLLATLLAPVGAQAELIVPDTGARPVFALDDTIMYQRVFGKRPRVSRVRPWMRVVDGRTLRARGVPRGARGSAIGRDHSARDTGGLVGAELGGTCERPGPTGHFPLPERPTRSYHRDVVGTSLYYAERDGVHRVIRPSRPDTGPPSNDAFANAIPVTAPSSQEYTIGNATTEPGEPALVPSAGERAPETRSAWFVLRPVTSQRLAVSGAAGVFTGSSVNSLQPVGTKDSGLIRFDAQAGQTYSIGVACPPFPDYGFTCHLPFDLAIRPG
jgi:hypothetical protein